MTTIKLRGENDTVYAAGDAVGAVEPKYTYPVWAVFDDKTIVRFQLDTAAPGLPGVWRANVEHYGTDAAVNIQQFDMENPPEGQPFTDLVIVSGSERLVPMELVMTAPPIPVPPPPPAPAPAPAPVAVEPAAPPAPIAAVPVVDDTPLPPEPAPVPSPPPAAPPSSPPVAPSPVEEPQPEPTQPITTGIFPGSDGGQNAICRWADVSGDLWLMLNGASLVPNGDDTYRLDGTLFEEKGPVVNDVGRWVGEVAVAWAARRTGMVFEQYAAERWNPDPSAQLAIEFFAMGQHDIRPTVRLIDGNLTIELADGHQITKIGQGSTQVSHDTGGWTAPLTDVLPFMATEDRLHGADPTAVLEAIEAQLAALQLYAIRAASRAVNALNPPAPS